MQLFTFLLCILYSPFLHIHPCSKENEQPNTISPGKESPYHKEPFLKMLIILAREMECPNSSVLFHNF